MAKIYDILHDFSFDVVSDYGYEYGEFNKEELDIDIAKCIKLILIDLSQSNDLIVEGISKWVERYDQMVAVYDACKNADVNLPDEVMEHFGLTKDNYRTRPENVPIELPSSCLARWSSGDQKWEGVDIIVKYIPEDVDIIRIKRRKENA